MTELLELTAAQAAERVRAGELSGRELFDAYRERAAAEDLNAFLWVADEAPPEPPAGAPPGEPAVGEAAARAGRPPEEQPGAGPAPPPEAAPETPPPPEAPASKEGTNPNPDPFRGFD
jgi:hypothetical protein